MSHRDLLSTFGIAAAAVTLGPLTAQATEPSGANAAQASSVPKPPYLSCFMTCCWWRVPGAALS